MPRDTKIIFIGGVLLLLVALTAGLFGSGVLVQQTEETIKRSLAMSAATRARLLEMGIERARHAVFRSDNTRACGGCCSA